MVALPPRDEGKRLDTAEVISVIRTTLLRRGNGTTTPIRVITQFWTLEGELLTEIDPLPDDLVVNRDATGYAHALGFEGRTFTPSEV